MRFDKYFKARLVSSKPCFPLTSTYIQPPVPLEGRNWYQGRTTIVIPTNNCTHLILSVYPSCHIDGEITKCIGITIYSRGILKRWNDANWCIWNRNTKFFNGARHGKAIYGKGNYYGRIRWRWWWGYNRGINRWNNRGINNSGIRCRRCWRCRACW